MLALALIIGCGSYRLGPLAVADLDADGVQDLLVTSPQAAEDRGRTWVFTGPLTGSLATDRAQLRVTGAAPWDWLGSSLAVGELDGDGRPDLLIGADHAGPGQEGRVYGFFGADLDL